MRLIDADALLERIMDINSWYLYNEWGSETEFHKLIDEAPTVEPTDTDLISRADAITEFREWVKRANENGETPTWNDAVSLIGSLPSADADVVRCKDCNGQGQPPAQPARGHPLLCSTVLQGTLCCIGDGSLESPGATPVFPPVSSPS